MAILLKTDRPLINPISQQPEILAKVLETNLPKGTVFEKYGVTWTILSSEKNGLWVRNITPSDESEGITVVK